MSDGDEVVSKGEFAKLCGISAGRVAQWISEGKISGNALVGTGRSAKIKVAIAKRQVNLRRDVGQALGNGLGTKLTAAAAKAPRPAEVLYDQEPLEEHVGDGSDDVDRKLKQAKLEQAERVNRMAAAEELASQGIYTETATVRAEMGKLAAQMIRIFEGALPEIATAIAAEFKLQARDVTHQLNEQFRKVREKASEIATKEAAGIPGTVET